VLASGTQVGHTDTAERATRTGKDEEMSKGGVLTLAAYLVREAACLDDHEIVVLDVEAEVLREMVHDALAEVDELKRLARDELRREAQNG
jgi:hypothetical protein